MDLILWRHAEAEDGGPDLERKLTPKGRKQAKRLAAWLLQRLPSKFALLSSPAVRARQTADALEARLKTDDRLAPGASVAEVLEAADWPRRKGAVVVVGHQPTLGCVAGYLVSGSPVEWSLKKGGLWWLTYRVRSGEAQVVVRAVTSPDMV
ncbi:MAG: phosphohistidine phosphatase [Betaproteobacteria bacterium SG8_39]|nr:MAG: phosphohistidine phosphatase [Betaproteobacteria bacterium SG8_39]